MAAIQVCESCRKRKRKCDKAKPSCSHCTRYDYHNAISIKSRLTRQRLRLKCTYLSWPYDRTGEKRSKSGSPSELSIVQEDGLTRRSDRPSASPKQYRDLDHEVTAELLNTIRCSGGAWDISSTYFMNVHGWLPIIFKPRFFSRLATLNEDTNPNFCLLILAMRLVTQDANESIASRFSLYHIVKSLATLTETSPSLDAVQARLLIAIFEMGRGLFPAANISIGAVASMAMSIGLQDKIKETLRDAVDWTYLEERKRAWWAIFIVDRYTGLRTKLGVFVAAEPSLDYYLPTFDGAWESQDFTDCHDFKVSTPFHIRIGPFARAAQASVLLGRALRNLYDPSSDESLNLSEYCSILRALRALNEIIPQEEIETCYLYCGSIGMVASALMILSNQNPYMDLSPGTSPDELSQSVSSPEEAASGAIRVAHEITDNKDTISIAALCPFVPDSLSQAAFVQLRLFQDTRDERYWKNLSALEDSLNSFSVRWKAAGMY
ncbi:hypothetical protein NA57DRAFT_45245 [Rhizodiscina lignyota]|uniref:Zn(2)-C6 fungal-type domain-containing protein n=1 Tax=Rhizodiscina lignyota TaxID=1504668 RepID=A0A9P4I8Z6_9PEZI|nr:hypothetical protein NA57DRAFT_45245 [Rhizodiscina lignyota]